MRRATLLGVLMAAGVLTMTVAAFQQPPGAPPARVRANAQLIFNETR